MCYNMICLIPTHNQSSYILDIVEGFESQIIKPSMIFFILDRCTDNSLDIIKSIKSSIPIDYVEKKTGKNFSAGNTRNFGFSVYKSRYGIPDKVLFMDGDCIPNRYVISEHIENLNRIDAPSVSCGRRKAYDKNGIDVGDRRDTDYNNLMNEKDTRDVIFSNRNGKLLHSLIYHKDFVATHSCNLSMNKKAIDLCININNRISTTKEDQIFNSRFDGTWGYEDNFIGLLLFVTNGYIFSCSNKSFVEHKYHKTRVRIRSRKNKRIFDALSHKLKKLIEFDNTYSDTIIQTDVLLDTSLCSMQNGLYMSYFDTNNINIVKGSTIYDLLVNSNKIKFDYLNTSESKKYLQLFFARNTYKKIIDSYNKCNCNKAMQDFKKVMKTYVSISNNNIIY